MKKILTALAIVAITATAAQAEMVFDPTTGTHVMVNSRGQQIDTGQETRHRSSSGGTLVGDGAGGRINTRTGEHLSPDMIGGYIGSDGTKYNSDGIGGQWDSEGRHYPGN